jgi:glycosyltransferase involved in cell wall biosynthesis
MNLCLGIQRENSKIAPVLPVEPSKKDGPNRPPRILVVHHSSVLGGAEASLKTHLEHARVCSYALASPRPAWPHDLPSLEHHARITIPASYKGFESLLAPLRLLRAFISLLKIASDFRPDLIVAYASMSMPVVAAVAAVTKTPCVWHVRESMSSRFPTKRLARLSARILVPSALARRTLTDRIPARDHTKIAVIPSPIAPNLFERPPTAPSTKELRAELGLPEDGPLVLLVAQHVPWKGHLDLIDALPQIRDEIPTVRLLLVGEAWTKHDQSYSRRIRNHARELTEQRLVFFLPPSPSIERYYWTADLLVLPSHGEPFGRVVFEAIAAGIPAIASEDTGVAPFLAQASADLVFRTGDRAALARAVVTAIRASREQKELWVQSGRAVLAQTCAANVVVPEIERIYVDAAASTTPRRTD